MNMTIYVSCDEGICNEPIADTSISGESVQDLKARLAGTVIEVLRLANERSDDYFVDYIIENDGVYVDSEEAIPCYCDVGAGSVEWKTL